MSSVWLVAGVGLAFAASTGVTRWLVPRLARAGVVDQPNPRSSHVRPTPRGGGAAVVLVGTASWALFGGLGLGFDRVVSIVLLGALVMAVLGAADDLRDLSVRTKLVVQCGVAASVIALGMLGGSTSPLRGLLLIAATVFTVGATNIFNFMDGIDGIAGGTAAAAGLVAAAAGALTGSGAVVAVGVALVGACLGFLTQNWSPAKVFLGDVGSLYLGFVLSALPLLLLGTDARLSLVLVAPLLPFLVDGSLTIVRRKWRRERLTTPHRSHLYQRAGRRWGHARVSAAYCAAALACGILPLVTYRFGVVATAASIAAVGCAAASAYGITSSRLGD